MRIKILSFFVLFINFASSYGRTRPCRNDYFYSDKGYGWFKIHKEVQSFDDAQHICEAEGTELVTVDRDIPWVKELVTEILTQNQIEEIYMKLYTDIYDSVGVDYEDAPSYNVFNRITGHKLIENKEKRAFICYFYGSKASFNGCDTNGTISENSRESNVQAFRSDYAYFKKVQGWLKYHPIPATFNEARLRCHLEGSILASPINYDLGLTMMELTKSKKGNHFFTGIHSIFSKGDYTSIEGVPISAIPTFKGNYEIDNYHDEERCIDMSVEGVLWDVPCNNEYPYICFKKQTENMTKQTECGTTDVDYHLAETGSCYKFHREPRTWSRAYMTCMAEGGHLAIINSEQEAQVLARISSAVPRKSIRDIEGHYFVHIGFHDWGEHGTWFTIHGQTLQEAGYEKWLKNEPNNLSHPGGVGEYCGSMTLTAEFNDICCEKAIAFICEKDPKSLTYKD